MLIDLLEFSFSGSGGTNQIKANTSRTRIGNFRREFWRIANISSDFWRIVNIGSELGYKKRIENMRSEFTA